MSLVIDGERTSGQDVRTQNGKLGVAHAACARVVRTGWCKRRDAWLESVSLRCCVRA